MADQKRIWRLGIDVGGTNTDAVVLDGEGRVRAWTKRATTDDITGGIRAGIADYLDAALAEYRESGYSAYEGGMSMTGYQTRDLLEAMHADWGSRPEGVLRVDGGMAASDWTMQFLADILGAPVDRPQVTETTALGAAYLAGLQAGICPEPARFAESWALQRRFLPEMAAAQRATKYARWGRAVAATMTI